MTGYFFSPAWRWSDSTKAELMMLRAYVTNVETQLRLGMIGLVEKEEIIVEEGTPDEHGRVIYDGIDDYDWDVESIYNEYFPSLHRSAVLLTLCAWFENTLNALCDVYQRQTGNPLSVAGLKGSGIVRARAYLKTVGGLDLTGDDHKRAWDGVTRIYKYRNTVAHVSGEMKSLGEQHRQAVQRTLALDNQSLELTDSSLHKVLNAFFDLAWTISKAAEDRHHALNSATERAS